MTILALFASTFSLVFALGIQQLNVQNNHRAAAVFTSIFIGAAQLAMLKLAPDATWAESAAFLSGGPLGIYAAMVAHPWLVRLVKRRKDI
jgi:hypothetical protein